MMAPVAPPASAPIAAPVPPPAIPPTMAPRPAPPATLRVVFLPSAAFLLDVGGHDLVLVAAERQRVRLQRDLVGAFHLAGLLDAGGLEDDDCVAWDDHRAVDH